MMPTKMVLQVDCSAGGQVYRPWTEKEIEAFDLPGRAEKQARRDTEAQAERERQDALRAQVRKLTDSTKMSFKAVEGRDALRALAELAGVELGSVETNHG